MRFKSIFLFASLSQTISGFGIIPERGGYTINTDSDMDVRMTDSGIIRKLTYKGTQYIGGQSFRAQSGSFGSGPRGTHFQTHVKGDSIVLQFHADDPFTGRFTGYYVFRKKENRIYIGMKPEAVKYEARYMLRLNTAVFGHCVNRASDLRGAQIPIETGDILARADGTTASKFFSSVPHKYNELYGIAGNNAGDGIWISLTSESKEGMSGGPFHRDITCAHDHRTTALSAYFYSGHSQSEPARNQLAWITVSLGEKPHSTPDLGFLDDLEIDEHVPRSKRGCVQGQLHERQPLAAGCSRSSVWYEHLKLADLHSFGVQRSQEGASSNQKRSSSNMTEYTVGLANAAAQYWADVSDGNIKLENVLPGTYQQTLYQDQLPVSSISVVVKAGACVSSDMTAPKQETPIWSIGCHDGRPHGFMNADLIERAHPQDVHMKWHKTTFTVGDEIALFPMAQMYGINNPTTLQFKLTEEQVKQAKTLRIATCSEYRGGYPLVTINGSKQKDYGMPPKLSAWGKEVVESRTMTHGAFYRSPRTYIFDVSGTLKPGLNIILIDAGGMGMMQKTFLQPNIVYDSVALL
ncbi:polysaccharide lyase family 4, domain III-domain-containing protein [Protomyces lactucae-debilis]|uniref:Polysaccharide lyase family 4, domain III-domain-containing protein n=1 Tax=Protomyces lactucae-debilis TaxID=2754530 RepID=A0A1Y2EZE1_PROLT|nr:polysaccharide lyase family 4, domain III-domain-containing protein [Protomyces lactucae-debilis]ORY76992.1 polysaccharide lyase family 4, domain III-domain-containing protein [Protomyces lactucae-debilis]